MSFFLFHSHRKEDVKEADTDKEAAMEAELRAARERAVVPLEARMTQFREMLLERGVNQCSYFNCYYYYYYVSTQELTIYLSQVLNNTGHLVRSNLI